MHLDTLRKDLERQLHKLETSNHAGAGHLSHQSATALLRVRLQAVDRLACEVESISVTDPSLATAQTDQLRQLADRLAEDLSYLEERLIVLEVDQVAHDVQLRSNRPREDDERRSYFEVHVSRQGIELCRYQKQDGSARTRVSAVLSQDILCRLGLDLIMAATGATVA